MKKSLHRKEYKILLRLLYEKRTAADIKQEELAEKLGVHQSYISKTENGDRRIDLVELSDFCEALGVNLVELVNEYYRRIKNIKSK